MPELPEVETIKNDLSESILGLTIKEVKILSEKEIRNEKKYFKNTLSGNVFRNIDRTGKLIIIELKNKKYLLIHLKMTGQLIFCAKNSLIVGGHSIKEGSFKDSVGGELPNKYTRFVINYTDGSKLFFNDLRRFGYAKIVHEDEKNKIVADYGIEPLKSDFSYKNLKNALKNRKIDLKSALLNQNIVSGLGNIYVDETLYDAGVMPTRKAGNLTDDELKRTVKSANKIIKKAIKHRGTTFNDYKDANGKAGNFFNLLKIHKRDGESCGKCGNKVEKIKIAGRSTYYCPKCQK